MLGKILRSKLTMNLNPIPQMQFKLTYKTVSRMDLIPERELFNTTYVKNMCKTRLPGYSMKSLRNLYHGVKLRSGHQLCYSDKKHKRWFKPNTHPRRYHSKILGKTFHIHVTTKALKTIRKYGGFDNYILLCKPDKMESFFGEYLRRIMYAKLNNPELDTANGSIFGTYNPNPRPVKPRTKMGLYLAFNKETRHKDLSGVNPHFFTEMTKKELKTVS